MTAERGFQGKGLSPDRDLEGRRQAILDHLTEAFASDRIHMQDYESRVAVVQHAHDFEELEKAVADLPAPLSPDAAARTPRTASTSLANTIDPRIAGSVSLACVMGDRNLSGDWLSGNQVGSFTCMGSTKIDLRDTALPPGRLKIDAFIIMGEMRVIVPRGLPVVLNAFPFMGETHADRAVERRVEPGQPFLEINGFAFMGSIRVVAGD
ncbi:MAG TPA: DUF1707 domain-containing protein [Rectinemataceae bacterium]|nr:DUF1707 domain-containing protein [Rectinemataceae bacterium]